MTWWTRWIATSGEVEEGDFFCIHLFIQFIRVSVVRVIFDKWFFVSFSCLFLFILHKIITSRVSFVYALLLLLLVSLYTVRTVQNFFAHIFSAWAQSFSINNFLPQYTDMSSHSFLTTNLLRHQSPGPHQTAIQFPQASTHAALRTHFDRQGPPKLQSEKKNLINKRNPKGKVTKSPSESPICTKKDSSN